MTRSEAIDALGTALATAQAAITPAKKDSENPHFRSKYADLASIWDACRAALTTAGLSVIQSPRLRVDGETWCVDLETLLMHTSGQFITDTLTLPIATPTAQAIGSAITYGRRYALAAFVGVAPDDDDGHAATTRRPASRVDRTTGELLDAPPQSEDRPAAPDIVTVKIAKIVKRPAGDSFRYVITDADDQPYYTFSESLATAAKAAQTAGLPVELVFSTNQYGRQIQVVRKPEPVDADPLPF